MTLMYKIHIQITLLFSKYTHVRGVSIMLSAQMKYIMLSFAWNAKILNDEM